MEELFEDFDFIFGPIRLVSLDYWKDESHRTTDAINDDITASIECKWQDRATLECGYEHISIFCSLGDWASNISDLLKEESYDFYSFIDEEASQALYRYYTRFLLVASEIISDFEEIVRIVNDSDVKRSRNFLSRRDGEVDSLLGFINSVCKHKVRKIHRCNHHLPIWFLDCDRENPYEKPISLSVLNLSDPDSILIPRLIDLLDIILDGYQRIDTLFESDEVKFAAICQQYDQETD